MPLLLPLSSPSLSCEVLCQSKRSRRENFIDLFYDLCKIAEEMICGNYWGDFHKIDFAI